MDSVTQFVLGAAVGEATLRGGDRHDGQRAFTWGAVLLGGFIGTLPDLDVLLTPFLSGPKALASHRGLSHSLFFCTLVTPSLAGLFQKLFSEHAVSTKRWLLFVWLGLNTHWMLDCFTMYGTQVFQPFSNYPVSGAAVFIVDPLYTLPLLFCTLVSVFSGYGPKRHNPKGVYLGLLLSTLYLGLAVSSKFIVWREFEKSWALRGQDYRRMVTVATPFNSIVWYAYVDTGENVWVADCSLFDGDFRDITWQKIPKNTELLSGFGEGPAGEVLLWFCRGFYRVHLIDGKPIFVDLRLGRLRGWLTPQEPTGADYIFQFRLQPESTQGPYEDFKVYRTRGKFSDFPFALLWRRIKGQR